MRILYINHYAGSPVHGMEYRPHYLARHWVRMGHEVRIVAATASHLRQKAPAVSHAVSEENVGGVRYVWLRTPTYAGNGAKRVLNMAAFVAALYRYRRRFLKKFNPDVVIASSTYTWDIFPAHAYARAAGAKLVFELHDLWPLSPIQLGGMSPYHPFIMSLQCGEDYACRHADAVVSMLPFAYLHLAERGMARSKFHYVPNGIELAEWQEQTEELPVEHRKFMERCRSRGRFVVCYAGSHGVSDALDVLLEAARRISAFPVDVMLVGHGPEKANLQDLATAKELPNVHFFDPVPKKAVASLLRNADALFIGAKKQPLYQFGVSHNKLMDYMAAGKPVINAIEAGNDAVRDAGCGVSVPAEDPELLAKAIIQMAGLPVQVRDEMGAAGVRYVRANHDYAVLAEKFLKAL